MWNRLCIVLVLGFISGGMCSAAADPGGSRLAVPGAEAQLRAGKLLDEVYKDELLKARTADQKTAMSRKIFKAATDTKDDPAGRYALLLRARDLSAEAGDVKGALEAGDALVEQFDLDALAWQAQGLTQLVKMARPADEKDVVGRVMQTLDAAIAADRYEVAHQLTDLGVTAAARSGDAALVKQTTMRTKEEHEIEAAYPEAQKALAALKQKPDDATASAAAGRFLCLMKGDWEAGLPLLAKGPDSEARQLATKELQAAGDPKAFNPDGWWDAAEKEQGIAKAALQRHAADWYTRAMPSLSGLAKAKAEKRIQEAGPIVGAPAPARAWVNLLRDVNGVKGEWKLQGGKLVLSSESTLQQRATSGFATRGDYELQVKFIRNSGTGAVCLFIPAGQGECILAMSGWNKQLSALFSKKFAEAAGATVPHDGLTNGHEYTLNVHVVLKDQDADLTITRDERPLMHWKGPQSDLVVPELWALPHANAFGFGGDNAMTFTEAKVRVLSGTLESLQKKGDAGPK